MFVKISGQSKAMHGDCGRTKISKAQECGDFRTIALISHASKILLNLIKRRITPIIERQLGDS